MRFILRQEDGTLQIIENVSVYDVKPVDNNCWYVCAPNFNGYIKCSASQLNSLIRSNTIELSYSLDSIQSDKLSDDYSELTNEENSAWYSLAGLRYIHTHMSGADVCKLTNHMPTEFKDAWVSVISDKSSFKEFSDSFSILETAVLLKQILGDRFVRLVMEFVFAGN